LFAGMGGFALAFKHAGFLPTWANELNKYAAQTYRHNHPNSRMIEGDVKNFSPHALGLAPPSVLTAGFPCQPFSSAGDRLGFDDDRGVLYREIVRILLEYGENRPLIVLLENVGNLLGHDGGRAYSKIENALKSAGYWVLPQNVKILNTRIHTDIPQNRDRVFIVALSTAAFTGGRFPFPEPEPKLRPIADFLDLDEKADDYYYFDVENNRFGQMIMRHAERGRRTSVYQLRRSYVREHQTFVPALTANMGDGGHNVPVILDAWGLRKMTPTECARLQGYAPPDFSFPLDMTRAQAFKQIGNSVTVPLIEKLAAGCRQILETSTAKREAA
jgi:DNA (cytosine-5)-methyltransferase 1